MLVGELESRLGGAKTVVLETCKHDGTWVPTPVSVVYEGDHAYFSSFDASGKFQRIAGHPQVRLTPASWRGKGLGTVVPCQARLLDGDEAEHARRLIAARSWLVHRLIVPFKRRRTGWRTVHYEVTAADREPRE